MSNEAKLVSVLANNMVAIGLKPPVYPQPKWYQLGLKRKLAYYDKNNWPYRLEPSHVTN
jgi:hypothetical protein